MSTGTIIDAMVMSTFGFVFMALFGLAIMTLFFHDEEGER